MTRLPAIRFYAPIAVMMIAFTLCPPLLVVATLWDSWRSRGEYDAWVAGEDDDLYQASYGVHGRPL